MRETGGYVPDQEKAKSSTLKRFVQRAVLGAALLGGGEAMAQESKPAPGASVPDGGASASEKAKAVFREDVVGNPIEYVDVASGLIWQGGVEKAKEFVDKKGDALKTIAKMPVDAAVAEARKKVASIFAAKNKLKEEIKQELGHRDQMNTPEVK